MGKLNLTKIERTLSCKETAELLAGKCGLSQRGYKALRAILKRVSVQLPDYHKVVEHLNGKDVGNIKESQCACIDSCYGISTDLVETLQLIINHKANNFEYPSVEQQEFLFKFLKEHDPKTYSSLDDQKRTLFLRQTGDNFRAAARMPTEQVSFSVLNHKEVSNSPYGQYINCLWRGAENRGNFMIHVKPYFQQLDKVAKDGIDLLVDGEKEHFNVIVFLIADIGLLEKILGKCTSTSMFGCFWCDQPKNDWTKDKAAQGKTQTIPKMLELGKKAANTLGDDPDHKSAKFVNFQHANLGKYVRIIFF